MLYTYMLREYLEDDASYFYICQRCSKKVFDILYYR